MLDGLRGFAKSWPGKILGAFLLVGVAGFGINNVITDLGSNVVARVGSQEITSREYLRAYQSQVNALAQQIGTVPTLSQAQSMGIPNAVLQGLFEGAAVDQLTGQLNLGVTEEKLATMLRSDPSFQGTLGNFDPAIFSQVLRQAGWTETEYFDARAREAKREQLNQTLFAGASLPQAALDLINGYAASQRTIDYIVLSDTSVETPAPPTEEEMAAYLAEHQAEYRTVETRKVQVLDLSVASLAATKTVSDDAVAAEYERTKGSLTTPERRTIEQVVLATPEQQALFETGLSAGRPFADLVAEAGLTPTAVGTLSRADVTDAALAEAAFALPADGYAVIDGVAGRRAIHVSAIEPEAQTSLEEARPAIVERLASAEARTEVNDVLDQIEELRAAFRPLPEIAERFGLEVRDLEVSAGGEALEALPNLTPEDRQRISQAIFKAEDGQLTPAISLTGNAHVWFDLVEVLPARDQTLDEVRNDISAKMVEERIATALEELANSIVARLDSGEQLADIGLSLNVFSQLSSPFTRFGSEDGTIDSTVASAAFAGGPGSHGTVLDGNGERYVFAVVDTTAPADPLDPRAVDSIDNEMRAGVYQQFVTGLQLDAQPRVNEQALNQLLANNFGQ